MPYTVYPNHRRRMRIFSTISKIFIPLGIVLLAIGATLLPLGIVGIAHTVATAETSAPASVTIEAIYSYLGLVFGIVTLAFGLPILLTGCVFRSIANGYKEEEQARVIDATDINENK